MEALRWRAERGLPAYPPYAAAKAHAEPVTEKQRAAAELEGRAKGEGRAAKGSLKGGPAGRGIGQQFRDACGRGLQQLRGACRLGKGRLLLLIAW